MRARLVTAAAFAVLVALVAWWPRDQGSACYADVPGQPLVRLSECPAWVTTQVTVDANR